MKKSYGILCCDLKFYSNNFSKYSRHGIKKSYYMEISAFIIILLIISKYIYF